MGKGTESGPYHGLPEKLDERMFTLVRDAPSWYRSIWGYLERMNWKEGGTESPLWNYLTQMLLECKSDVFDEFIVNVYAEYPGIYTWMYSSLAPPGVIRIHYAGAGEFMRNVLDITHIDETPIDMTPGLPKITHSVRDIISSMEA
jgi:hypothetical protein